VPTPNATDEDLRRLHEAGIEGSLFLWRRRISAGDAKNVARRMRRWAAPAGCRLAHRGGSFFSGLASDVVVDHVGRIDADGGVNNPHFISLLRFLESGRGWVKISGPYYSDIPPHYTEFGKRVKALVEVRPTVWSGAPTGPIRRCRNR